MKKITLDSIEKSISWIYLDHSETYELKQGEKVIGTHLASSPYPELDDDTYSIVLVIENTEVMK